MTRSEAGRPALNTNLINSLRKARGRKAILSLAADFKKRHPWTGSNRRPIFPESVGVRGQSMGVDVIEPKMSSAFPNRRLQNRYTLPAETEATLEFSHPPPHGPRFSARVRDVSLSGLSMILP